MKTNKQIAKEFGLDRSYVSRLLSKEEKRRRAVSLSLAIKLTQLFPSRDFVYWKNASRDVLLSAFNQDMTTLSEMTGKDIP